MVGQEAVTSTIHREDIPSGNNEKVTDSATAAVVNTQRGLKRKQVRTDKGKVLKSRMLGVQTAQIEEVCIKLSKQRKHRFSKRMWPYGRKKQNTYTHTSKVSSERSLRYFMNWNFPSPSRGGLDNTTPVQ